MFGENQKEADMLVNAGGGGSNALVPAAIPEVQQAVKSLDIELDELEKAVEALGVRLDVVMRPPMPPNTKPQSEADASSAHCALAATLEKRAERVATYRETIDAFRNRLEI
jgi:nicotinate-nucleotide pyrophosphorylase